MKKLLMFFAFVMIGFAYACQKDAVVFEDAAASNGSFVSSRGDSTQDSTCHHHDSLYHHWDSLHHHLDSLHAHDSLHIHHHDTTRHHIDSLHNHPHPDTTGTHGPGGGHGKHGKNGGKKG